MKVVLKNLFPVLILLLKLTDLAAQDLDEGNEVSYKDNGRGWIFGLNFGVYYPSKSTANYYNGSPENENNVNLILDNYYRRNELMNALDNPDSIALFGLPTDMHYKLAIQPGIYAQYCFNSRLALVIQFNYMQLKANDVIIFEIDPKPYATEPDLSLNPMRGIEERVYADIGLKRTFPQTAGLSYFLIGGINVNSTKVKKSSFYVNEKEFSMINIYGDNTYVPNSNVQTYNIYQGGIGFGMHISAGVALKFGNGIVMEPGVATHWLMVKLKGYSDMNPGMGAYVRFMF